MKFMRLLKAKVNLLITRRHGPGDLMSASRAGFKIDEAQWNKMLDDYYDLHGWDRETSFPTRKALADLDLDYVADELEKIGKLGL